MFVEDESTTQSCGVCEYIRVHGWVGPGGRHHCKRCHRTWTGSTQMHCVTCHSQFSNPTACALHETRDACQDPALVKTKVYELIAHGDPETLTIGRDRRIPVEPWAAYVEHLCAEAVS